MNGPIQTPRAYLEGRAAFKPDTVPSNPYPVGTFDHDEWANGLKYAERDWRYDQHTKEVLGGSSAEPKTGWFASRVRCNVCTQIDTCVYPETADEATLECSSCGACDSEVIERIPPSRTP